METDRSSVAATGDPFAGARILVVDDEPANIELLRAVLEGAGDVDVTGITDSSRVVDLVAAAEPHIVLLDLHMPPPMGLEVLTQLRERFADGGPPVLMLTADPTLDMRRRALGLGRARLRHQAVRRAGDRAAGRNLLQARRYELSLASRADELEAAVRSRTEELEDARLRRLSVSRWPPSTATTTRATTRAGSHRTARLLGSSLGLSARELDLLELAAPLHDVGKIAVPDSVLLKPGG